MTFAQASWLRVVQMIPLPFCFISITTAAYVGMPKEDRNQVAGLINFARNIGGSILIAVTNAQVTSRAMWHQQHLQSAMNSGLHRLPAAHASTRRLFSAAHFGGANSSGLAMASIYNQLNQQAQMQGYQDVYMELSWMSLLPRSARLHAQQESPRPGPQRRGGPLKPNCARCSQSDLRSKATQYCSQY